MRRLVCALLAVTFLLTLAPNETGAQAGPPSAAPAVVVCGVVRDNGAAPIAGAVIEVLSVGRARTDSVGAYRLVGLPAGTLIVRATMIGFQPVMKMVTAAAGEELLLDLTMARASQQLPTVVVREDSSFSPLMDPSGFDERRKTSAGGHFITADEIERTHVIDTESLFHGIPTVQVDTAGIIVIKRGELSIRDFYPGGQFFKCVGAQVFVDGIAMPQPFDINTISIHAIRGIEIYSGPATTPMALRSPKTVCGTVAIWTKRK